MNDEDFSKVLDNIKDLTILQICKLVVRLKYKTIAMMATFIITSLTGAFAVGRYSHQQDTAVLLHSPFSMRISVGGEDRDFNKLTLMRDPTIPDLYNNSILLSLREFRSPFDIVPIGSVLAQKEENKLSGLWKVLMSKINVSRNAYGAHQSVFNWYGHQNDQKFKERFISSYTIHRHYSDGCVLAYDVDENRRSIPSSFRWVKRTH